MSNSAKDIGNRKAGRSATTGRFIGRSKDGMVIAKPTVKPRSFTERELRRVIRDMQREKAG